MMIQNTFLFLLIVLIFSGCSHKKESFEVKLNPTLELKTTGNDLYTPATQSLLRTHSWLEDVKDAQIIVEESFKASFLFQTGDEHFLGVENLPLEQIIPRLHYKPSDPPDDFDAFNLMMAEYSRNSISIPQGGSKDKMAHFNTNLQEKAPWKLVGDYNFKPNKFYNPLRVSIVNNCLKPGLWELNAVDRSGEIYHSWFDMPLEFYYRMVAEKNHLDLEFVKKALEWQVKEVKLNLSALRTEKEYLGKVDVSLLDKEASFSSQGSRRKIHQNFVMVSSDSGIWKKPEKLSQFYESRVQMSSFVEPGIYSYEKPTEFDFAFLAGANYANVKKVNPKTSYKLEEFSKEQSDDTYIEIEIHLPNNEKLVIGNLPLHLLVRQEDFVIHGFGNGILDAAGLAERRQFLLENGPAPSYAYLAKEKDGDLYALNSHERGIEQIFIRSHPFNKDPHWEIIITSYERIIDLVNYKIDIPAGLQPLQKEQSENYIPPIYFTYQDNNVN